MADTPAEIPSGWEHEHERSADEFSQVMRERAERLLDASSGLLIWGAAQLDLLAQRVRNQVQEPFILPERQKELAPPNPDEQPCLLPVKAERAEPPSDRINFTWDYRFVHEVMDRADELNQTFEEFMMSAFAFEMTWRTFRGHSKYDQMYDETTRIVGVPRVPSAGMTSRLSAHDIEQRFASPYNGMKGGKEVKILAEFDEGHVATMMLAIADSNGIHSDGHMTKQGERDTQLSQLGAFARRALTHYMAKIDAEAAGWDIMLDRNLGEDAMIPLDALLEGGNDAEA